MRGLMLSFTAPREEFAQAVTRAAQGLPDRPHQPVYAGLLLEVNGPLSVTGTDGEVVFTARAQCAGNGGRILLPGAMLLAITKYLPGDEVRLKCEPVPEGDGVIAEITSGRSSYTLPATEGVIFPGWDPPPALVMLDGAEFADAAAKVTPAASRTDPVLRAVALVPEGEKLNLVATDRYAMALLSPRVTAFSLAHDTAPPPQALVPSWVAERFGKLAGDSVSLGWDDKLVMMSTSGFDVSARQIAGRYPGWRKIMAQLPDAPWALLVTADVARAVKAAALVLADDGSALFRVSSGGLTIAAAGPAGGCTEHADAEFEGGEFTFRAQPKYLLAGLSGCGPSAEIAMNQGHVYLRSGEFTWMVQPVREMGEL
jgi:DNA polymerase III subunit beta